VSGDRATTWFPYSDADGLPKPLDLLDGSTSLDDIGRIYRCA
jgi:hypothetical protein